MTNEEVNKIIAEFMDGEGFEPALFNAHLLPPTYTKSLDALVPVWEKLLLLSSHGEILGDMFLKNWEGRLSSFWYVKDGEQCSGNTVQQAAAHATAKAILEINK